MSPASPERQGHRRLDLLAWLAFVIPLGFWLFFAGSGPGWGISAGSIAASWSLEWPASSVSFLSLFPSKIATWIPFGDIAFRLTLLSALWMALASWLFYRSSLRLLAFASHRPLASLLLRFSSLALTLGLFGGSLASSIASSAGPHALSVVFFLASLDTLLDARFSPLNASRLRHLRLALLWAFFGVLHQPLLAFPWLVWIIGWGRYLRGFPTAPVFLRRLLPASLALLLLLLVILPLEHRPLRTSVFQAQPTAHLHPSAPFDRSLLLRVMPPSTRPFLDELTADEEDDPFRSVPWLYTYPSPSTIALLLRMIFEHLGAILASLGFLGLLFWFRSSRVLASLLLSGLALGLWPLLWLPFHVQDATFQASLLPFHLLLVLASLSLLGRGLRTRTPLGHKTLDLRGLSLAAALGGWMYLSWLALFASCDRPPPSSPFELLRPYVSLTRSPYTCAIRDSKTALRWSEMLEETLPLDAILATSHDQESFLRWYRHQIDLRRPDVTLLSKNPAITPRQTFQHSKKRDDLALALRAFRRDDLAYLRHLRALSKDHPICIEWNEALPPSLTLSLYPIGLLFFWSPDDPVVLTDSGFADDDGKIVLQQDRFWKDAYRQLLPFLPYERHLLLLLFETHFRHARFYLQSLRWQAARAEVRRALFLMPSHPTLRTMLSEIRSHPFFSSPKNRPPLER